MRFHFFDFFAILMTSGTSWDLILDTFGGLETPFWWFLAVLEIEWNFIDFLDHPKLREWTWLRVNCRSRGYSIPPDCWPAGHQIADTSPADGILKGTEDWVLKSLPSQPGGPWQAGAGGYTYTHAYCFLVSYFFTLFVSVRECADRQAAEVVSSRFLSVN